MLEELNRAIPRTPKHHITATTPLAVISVQRRFVSHRRWLESFCSFNWDWHYKPRTAMAELDHRFTIPKHTLSVLQLLCNTSGLYIFANSPPSNHLLAQRDDLFNSFLSPVATHMFSNHLHTCTTLWNDPPATFPNNPFLYPSLTHPPSSVTSQAFHSTLKSQLFKKSYTDQSVPSQIFNINTTKCQGLLSHCIFWFFSSSCGIPGQFLWIDAAFRNNLLPNC